MKKNKKGGFTLLELLIVIAIIAILSVALVIVLNPAETLKKARDAQRISDLSTLKTAIGLYMTSVSPVYLGGASSNTICKANATDAWGAGTYKISYSFPSDSPGAAITDTTLDGGTVGSFRQATAANGPLTNGNGWVPINFDGIAGGSPISNIPLDPTNIIVTGTSTLSSVSSDALVYRYGCSVSPLSYEIDATLESTAYTVTDDKRLSDGGNSTKYYETGTNLGILGVGGSNLTDY